MIKVRLCSLIVSIRMGVMHPLDWGPKENIRVPVVACRRCKVARADDGTRCYSCDAYQNLDVQRAADMGTANSGTFPPASFGPPYA